MSTVEALFLPLAQQLAGSDAPGPLPAGTTGYGVQLVRSLAALGLVCALAWWSLRWAAKRGLGVGARLASKRGVRVVERVPLDARRSVFVVEVGTRTFLLGASEQSLSLLAELSRDELPARDAPAPAPAAPGATRFAEVLARLRGPPAPEAPAPPARSDD